MSHFDSDIAGILPEITVLRHELHAHPELGFEEHWTAERIAAALRQVPNLRVQTGVAKTGIVAHLDGKQDGPCLALRADMDALPIVEETGLAYASQHDGRMHACGHDGHMSCLVGAATVLARYVDRLNGSIRFIFQPAEENLGGGRDVCQAGALEDPRVDAAIALHGWPSQAVGTVSLTPGPAMASTDSGAIIIHGKGTHGAYPHRGVDPILVASHIVVALQSITARNVDPLDSVVVTVGAIHGGQVCNVIPPHCRMEITLRALRPETRQRVRQRVHELVEHTACAHGATAEILIEEGYPVLINDPPLADWMADVARNVLGAEAVRYDPPSMGAEDFAYYGAHVPIVMFRLGVRPADADGYPGLHNPRYDFTDAALPVGIRLFCELAERFLRERPVAAR
jgi:amidohydrolase